jgi:hypothetical protein
MRVKQTLIKIIGATRILPWFTLWFNLYIEGHRRKIAQQPRRQNGNNLNLTKQISSDKHLRK